MRHVIYLCLTSLLLLNLACESEADREEQESQQEPIRDRLELLKKQGDIKGVLDPFELIEYPAYSPVHEVDYLRDEELVFLTRACGFVQVFPYRSMHVEVVNEVAHGVYLAITFCPITRSGLGLNRIVGEDTVLLTASGYLYRENLMPLDVHSGSIWSQMLFTGFSGKHEREQMSIFPLIETTWATVKQYFPGAGVYVNKSFTKSAQDLPVGQEMGLIGREEVELFTLDMFQGEIKLLHSVVSPGGRVVVAGSLSNSYMVPFITNYEMQALEGEFPVIMKDETGTRWNVFGEAVSGERGGEKLQSPVFFSAADWAWRNLYDQVSYYAGGGLTSTQQLKAE